MLSCVGHIHRVSRYSTAAFVELVIQRGIRRRFRFIHVLSNQFLISADSVEGCELKIYDG